MTYFEHNAKQREREVVEFIPPPRIEYVRTHRGMIVERTSFANKRELRKYLATVNKK